MTQTAINSFFQTASNIKTEPMDPIDDLVNITFNKVNESLSKENYGNIKHEPMDATDIKTERRQSYSSVETDNENDFERTKTNLRNVKNEPGSGDDTENDDEDNVENEENNKKALSERQPYVGEQIRVKEEENNSGDDTEEEIDANEDKSQNKKVNDSDGLERIQRSSNPETNYNPFNARPTFNPFAEPRNVKIELEDRYAPMDYGLPPVVKTEPQNDVTQFSDAQMELENIEAAQANDEYHHNQIQPMSQTMNVFEMDQTSTPCYEMEQSSTTYQSSQPSTSHQLEQPSTSYRANQASSAFQMDSTSSQTNKASGMYDYMTLDQKRAKTIGRFEIEKENDHKKMKESTEQRSSMSKYSLLELESTNIEIEDDGFDLRPEVLNLVKDYRENKIKETKCEFDRIRNDLRNSEKRSERGELMKRLNKVIDDMQKQTTEINLEKQRESEEEHEIMCTQFLREIFDEFFDQTKWEAKIPIRLEQKYGSKPSTSKHEEMTSQYLRKTFGESFNQTKWDTKFPIHNYSKPSTSSCTMPKKSHKKDRKRLNYSEFMHIRKKPKVEMEKAKALKLYDECAKKLHKQGQSVPKEMIKPVLRTKEVICGHVKRFLQPLAQKHSLDDNVFTLITKNATSKHFQSEDYGKLLHKQILNHNQFECYFFLNLQIRMRLKRRWNFSLIRLSQI